MDDGTSMGRLIRESRLRRGMSLGQLAATVGRSPSSVRRWERDEVAPAVSVMPRLADALEIDMGDLEMRRPDPDADTPVDDEVLEVRLSTVEQAVVSSEEIPLMVTAPPETQRHLGLFGEMWNTVFAEKESWIGWVRGIATAAVLIGFLFILVWALGEFFEAISQVWDSFGTGG